MMRVLNIMGSLNCGGMETSVMNYYRHIDRTKVQFDFLLIEGDEPGKKDYFEDEAISLGARIFKLSNFKKHPVRYIKRFSRIFRDNEDIKAVHIHHWHAKHAAVYALLSMLNGINVRIVYSSSDIREFCTASHKLFRPLLRLTATHWFAGSANAGLSMYGKKAKDKLILTPRARDLDAFRYNPQKRQLIRHNMYLKNNYVILTVGRLTAAKNQVFLLQAYANALSRNPNMILLIAGDGEQRTYLETEAAKLCQNSTVKFLGLRNDISDLLQAADIFVLPSLYEGLPGVVIEAQAAGLPCLVSDRVSTECKITDMVEFLPIDKGAGIWAERMLAHINTERMDTAVTIRNAGYDIKEAAKDLTEFYLECVCNKEI